ncbi:hypothetical protein QYZ87_08360 [Porphyromonadaceae bacterium W3.11]|nr:hypothetical protein [Porphyromonadaceae bacterium W3.11]
MNNEINKDERRSHLTVVDKWAPTFIVCAIALVVMLVNFLTIDMTQIYTFTMLASCILSVIVSVWWARKHPINTVDILFNVIAIFGFILLISFLFMVLPTLL